MPVTDPMPVGRNQSHPMPGTHARNHTTTRKGPVFALTSFAVAWRKESERRRAKGVGERKEESERRRAKGGERKGSESERRRAKGVGERKGSESERGRRASESERGQALDISLSFLVRDNCGHDCDRYSQPVCLALRYVPFRVSPSGSFPDSWHDRGIRRNSSLATVALRRVISELFFFFQTIIQSLTT